MMTDGFESARALLQRHFGFTAFRPTQARIIRSVLAGRDTLGILPTGGGKSVCFQVPSLISSGFTLVVSPLIALMQDQVAGALARGIPAASLAGPMRHDEIGRVLDAVAGRSVRLVYVSPERLERLCATFDAIGLHPRLIAVDEAHCIAEWGHDFRPSYRALRAVRERLGRPPVIALTGSATPRVRAEIADALDLGGRARDFDLHLASFDRRNLWLGVERVRSERERFERLLALLGRDDIMSIVYAPTRRSTEAVAAALRSAGHRAVAYHAGLDSVARAARLKRFLADELDVMVATSAFGMGIDKPTVRLVVHWSLPATPESYYQEVGRAGRDGDPARCVLLYRAGDADVHRRQLSVTFPERRLVEALWRGERAAPLPDAVRISADRLRAELRPEKGRVDWGPVERRRRAAAARIDAMEGYARRRGCLRADLMAYFGEDVGRCAGCAHCRGRTVRALGTRIEARSALQPGAAPSHPRDRDPVVAALEEWRLRTAAALATSPADVLGDAAIAALATQAPATPADVARVAGLGPRMRAKFAATLAAITDRRGEG